MESAVCICGEKKFKTKYEFVKGKRLYAIVTCCHCGMCYMNPRPSKKNLENLYKKNYYYDENFLDTRNYQKALRLYSEMQQQIKAGSVLDIGCSKGFLLAVLKEAGHEAFGIEPSKGAIAFAKKHFSLSIKKGYFDSATFTRKFNTITAIDVIEHVQDPLKTLKKIHSLLLPKGKVVIETPNVASIYAKISGKRWMGFDIPFHLYFFSPKHLQQIMAEAGFHNIQVKTTHFNILSREGINRSKGLGSFLILRSLLKFFDKDPDKISAAVDAHSVKLKRKQNKYFAKRSPGLLDRLEMFLNKPINTIFAKKFLLGDAIYISAEK